MNGDLDECWILNVDRADEAAMVLALVERIARDVDVGWLGAHRVPHDLLHVEGGGRRATREGERSSGREATCGWRIAGSRRPGRAPRVPCGRCPANDEPTTAREQHQPEDAGREHPIRRW
jgi:hypothetical protein